VFLVSSTTIEQYDFIAIVSDFSNVFVTHVEYNVSSSSIECLGHVSSDHSHVSLIVIDLVVVVVVVVVIVVVIVVIFVYFRFTLVIVVECDRIVFVGQQQQRLVLAIN
jgi:hypothetical protein